MTDANKDNTTREERPDQRQDHLQPTERKGDLDPTTRKDLPDDAVQPGINEGTDDPN